MSIEGDMTSGLNEEGRFLLSQALSWWPPGLCHPGRLLAQHIERCVGGGPVELASFPGQARPSISDWRVSPRVGHLASVLRTARWTGGTTVLLDGGNA